MKVEYERSEDGRTSGRESVETSERPDAVALSIVLELPQRRVETRAFLSPEWEVLTLSLTSRAGGK